MVLDPKTFTPTIIEDVSLIVNGIKFSGFTAASVTKALNSFTNTFDFDLTQQARTSSTGLFELTTNEIKLQDTCQVYIGDTLVITGYVENLSIDYSASSHSIKISGRDRTGDLVDSSIIPKSYNGITNIIQLFKLVLSQNGFGFIDVVQDFTNIPGLIDPLAATEVVKAEEGETIFQFLDKYAKKVQVLLRTTADGNVQLTRESSFPLPTALISLKNNRRNNILNASVSMNTNDRFGIIDVYAQSKIKQATSISVSQKGQATDANIRSVRKKRLTYKVATEKSYLDLLAQWNVNIKKARASNYTCKVVGYRADKAGQFLWEPNFLVTIQDDKCYMDGSFLIESVTYSKSLSGSTTDIKVVNSNSYNLTAGGGDKIAADVIAPPKTTL